MVDDKELLNEFMHCLEKEDTIKMTIVLVSLPQVAEATVSEVLQALIRSGATFLIESIVQLWKKYPEMYDEVPDLRNVLVTLLMRHPDEIIPLIGNGGTLDAIPALEAARQLQYKAAVGTIETLLLNNVTGNCARKAIEVLGEFGMPSSVKVLGGFLYSSDRSLIGAAVHALGNIATPTAIERLAESTGSDAARDILVVREFARLQLPVAMEKLVSILCSQHTQLRNYAKGKIAETGTKALPYLINVLQSGDADWTVQALNLLGEIGDDTAGTAVRKLLQQGPQNANVRFAAYEALESIRVTAGGYTLTEGLLDKDEQVAFAAARAVNANLTGTMVNGLKALVSSDAENRDRYLKILLNSEADEVVKALAGDAEIGKRLASLLNEAVQDDVHRHFREAAAGWDDTSFSDALKGRRYSKKTFSRQLWVVDDSKTILSLYKTALSECNCSVLLFEDASAVLEKIVDGRPSMIFTDLNMPVVNGIELIRKIRHTYSKKELPIVLVTTQSDVRTDKDFMHEEVNEIVIKPFSPERIRNLVDAFLT